MTNEELQALVAELERQLQQAEQGEEKYRDWVETQLDADKEAIAELEREKERLREALTFAISRWRDQAQALPPMSIGRINSTALANKLEEAIAQTPKPPTIQQEKP